MMRRFALAAAVVLVTFGALGVSGSAGAAGPPNIPPTAKFGMACYGKQAPTKGCDTQAINNINSARATEGLGPIVLPGNYASLTLTQKEIAVSNAERAARGISVVTEVKKWDRLAKQGADANADPIGPEGHSWGSIWAGVADPLAADYLWMYWDGPGSPNADCVNPGDPGCFGHRNNILGGAFNSIGAGHNHASLAELFVG
jgi:hypothetical protein